MTNTEYSMNRDDAQACIRDLARQDKAGETHDSYALTGDAVDTIRRWYRAGAEAGDQGVCAAIDFLGVRKAATIYSAAYEGK